ncbi:PREDICTED: UBA-like domain-containing protein 1, partial [Papilio xuthus]|uniref:UBA-like domain-containing protein 1 n=1 Tax=Papilio xuthus TaxID=66420 RepID=A0AAJ6ZZF9_PAPXU
IPVTEKRTVVSSAASGVPSMPTTSSAAVASPASAPTKPGALSYTGAIVGARGHTFAAKVAPATASVGAPPPDNKPHTQTATAASSPGSSAAPLGSPLKTRESPPAPTPNKGEEAAHSPDGSWPQPAPDDT